MSGLLFRKASMNFNVLKNRNNRLPGSGEGKRPQGIPRSSHILANLPGFQKARTWTSALQVNLRYLARRSPCRSAPPSSRLPKKKIILEPSKRCFFRGIFTEICFALAIPLKRGGAKQGLPGSFPGALEWQKIQNSLQE